MNLFSLQIPAVRASSGNFPANSSGATQANLVKSRQPSEPGDRSEHANQMPLTLEQELNTVTARSWWQRLMDGLFGYDFFISYRWEDGRVYAVRLASELQQRGYDCFLDSESYAKGDNWKMVGARAIRRTSRLVLIGSPCVKKSEPVLREVRIFSRNGRKIIPINFGNALSPESLAGNPLAEFVTPDLIEIREPLERLAEGPAESTIRELQKTFNHARQSERRLRALQVAAVGLFIVAVLAVMAAFTSFRAKQSADRITKELQDAANKTAAAAQQKENAAKREADSIRVAGEALGLFESDRELARLLAAEAVKLSPTREAQRALRKTLAEVAPPLVLRGHGSNVLSARFSADNKRVLTYSADGTARLWDTSTGSSLRTFGPLPRSDSNDRLFALLSPDGTKVLIMKQPHTLALGHWESDIPLQVYDAATGQLLFQISDTFASSAEFSPDSKQIVTASFSNTPRIRDASTGKVQFELAGHETTVSSATFSSNGTWVATGSRDGTVRIWEARTGRGVVVLRVGQQIEWAVFMDGSRLLVLAPERLGEGKEPELWDWKESPGSRIRTFVGHKRGFYMEGSENGARFATGNLDEVRIWETASGKCLAVVSADKESVFGEIGVFAFSPNGECVVTIHGDGSGRIWDATTGERLAELIGGKASSSAYFSPDSTRFATAMDGNDALIFSCKFCGDATDLLELARDVAKGRQLTSEEKQKYRL